jgi:fermentation-respiration switch protein FrsA (DUF1100 family)
LRLFAAPFAALLVAFAFAGCGSSGSQVAGAARVETVGHYRVQTSTESYRRDGRVLLTIVYHPADRGQAPYPLIVFAHGLGSNPADYETLLEDWSSAGYVVAAPRFPFTSSGALGGPNFGDYVNQPRDMSFVISSLLGASSRERGALAGLVDPHRVGAAGHSLGGLTTLGLVANTCCLDQRVEAAVVMAGDAVSFPSGRADFAAAPPILFVHGDADQDVPYAASVEAFDSAHPPKALLTIEGGGHGSPVDPSARAFETVVQTTTAFFDRYLKGEPSALDRMRADGSSPATRLALASERGTKVVLPVPSAPAGSALRARVTPDNGLADGQSVTVSWEGYRPGTTVNVLECSKSPPTGPGDCDLENADLLKPDPTGSGSLPFVVRTGAIGGAVCDAAHPGCVIVVNQGGSTAPSASAIVPIAFSSP